MQGVEPTLTERRSVGSVVFIQESGAFLLSTGGNALAFTSSSIANNMAPIGSAHTAACGLSDNHGFVSRSFLLDCQRRSNKGV